jgi:hypothetical protein
VQQDDHVVIRVEFNDKSTFRGFHFTDYRNFTRGILGRIYLHYTVFLLIYTYIWNIIR